MINQNIIKTKVAKKIGVKIDYTPEEVENTRQEILNGTKKWCTDNELIHARKIVNKYYEERYIKVSN